MIENLDARLSALTDVLHLHVIGHNTVFYDRYWTRLRDGELWSIIRRFIVVLWIVRDRIIGIVIRVTAWVSTIDKLVTVVIDAVLALCLRVRLIIIGWTGTAEVTTVDRSIVVVIASITALRETLNRRLHRSQYRSDAYTILEDRRCVLHHLT